MSPEELLSAVKTLAATLSERPMQASSLSAESRLFDDLGLDSLKLVDLTMELEDRLGIEGFPLQAWLDDERRRPDGAFTLGSLACACAAHREATKETS